MKASERQRLKHDKYADTVVVGLGWARMHLATIVGVLVALVIVIVALSWWNASRRQAGQDALALLKEAQEKARQAVAAEPADKDRLVAQAVERLQQIAADYPSSDAAPLALLEAANTLSQAGKPVEAQPLYRKALQRAGKLGGLEALARQGLAVSLESEGKYADAIEEYRAFLEPAASPYAAKAHWDIGRCLEKLDRPQEAAAAYQQAVEFGGQSEWAELARFRLSHLAAGPAISAAPAAPTTSTVAATTTTIPEISPAPGPEGQ